MRLKIYGIIGIVVALIIVGFYLYPKPFVINESFEIGFDDWIKDAQVPLDPNNPGHYVFWNVSRTNSLAYSGSYSLNFSIDGRQDDGTIWIERRIPVRTHSSIQVRVSFQLYSEFESQANMIAGVVVYAGINNPENEDDFQILGPTNQVSGWKEYDYMLSLNTSSSDEIWIALGITVLWETQMSYNIDDVRIEIT